MTSAFEERINRLNGFVEHSNPLVSDNDTLDMAMAWIVLTTDELVTCQQGNGGVPSAVLYIIPSGLARLGMRPRVSDAEYLS